MRANIIASTWCHSHLFSLRIQGCRPIFIAWVWLGLSGHWRCHLQGAAGSLLCDSSVKSRLWFQCSYSKAMDTAARQWLKQMADCDKPLLIANKNTRSYTALCTNTWDYCRFLCISRFYFKSVLIFSMQNPHGMSNHIRCVFEASTAVCEIQDFLKNQPSKQYSFPINNILRFRQIAHDFGVEGENNFDFYAETIIGNPRIEELAVYFASLFLQRCW